MLHGMPQHLTILTTGSVFQRKLQVFSRARGRFMRAVAAGETSFLLTQIRLWNEPNFEPTRLRDCAFRFSLSLFFSFLIKLTKLMSLYSYSFYSRSNRRRSPYAETSKTGGVLDPGALVNLDGPPKISFSSTHAGAGNAPDDKKKGRVKKLTTFEQKILLLCLHLL